MTIRASHPSRGLAAPHPRRSYRPLLALVLATSAAPSASLAAITLFAHSQLHASDVMVTVYFVAVALANAVVVLATGRRSDRAGGRRVLTLLSLGWLTVGYALLSGVRSYGALLAVGAVFLGVHSVTNAQLLAYGRDLLRDEEREADSVVVIGSIRMTFSIGSFTGFGLGGLGIALLGYRGTFLATATVFLGCVGLAEHVFRRYGHPTPPAEPSPRAGPVPRRSARRLVGFLVIMVLFSSGRVMQLSQLPLVVHDVLRAPPEFVGVLFAIPPMSEIVLMPMVARAAIRWGRGGVFLLGGAACTLYYGGLVVAATLWQLGLLQLCYAVFGACGIMVGIDLAQRLAPERAGMATSSFLSQENLATVNGSLVALAASAYLGPRTGFVVPAASCLVALILATVLFRRHRDAFDLRPMRGVRP
jgi:MFS family permease